MSFLKRDSAFYSDDSVSEIQRVLLGCSEQLALVVSIILRVPVAIKSSERLDVFSGHGPQYHCHSCLVLILI